MLEEMDDFLSMVKKRVKEEGGGIWHLKCRDLSASTVNILWALMTGKRYPSEDPILQDTIILNDMILEAIGFDNKYNAFPFLKTWFPKWSGYLEHEECYRKFHEFTRVGPMC